MKSISLAVAALIANVSAVNHKSSQDLIQSAQSEVTLTELNRYIGGNGQPINLAETTGHARLMLTKVRKTSAPIDVATIQLQKEALQGAKTKDAEHNDCAINKPGEKVTAHIQQQNLEDNAYVSDIYVGNPPQKVRALFDTGSTNTWILNAKTNIGEGKEKQYSYDDTKSSTFNKTDQKAHITFGSGSLAGHFVTDDVRVGSCDEKSSGQIHIKNQKFGNVEMQKTIFTGSNFESIVGLAYPALAEKNVTPVFDEMINQKLLKDNIFAFYLTSKQSEAGGNLSDLTFGYYDKAKFEGEVHWNPVEYQYMFGVPFENIIFNGKESNICQDNAHKCLITFDSGTSLMSMPKYATDILAQKGVPSASHVKKCDSENQYGTMAFVIGGKNYELSNDEWMFPAKDISMGMLAQGGKQSITFRQFGPLGPQIMTQLNNDDFLEDKPDFDADFLQAEADIKAGKKSKDFKACSSTIMTMDISHKMFLVGDVFMRKYYTIFDRDTNRVGLAQAKGYLPAAKKSDD